jgi:hypothetical protein
MGGFKSSGGLARITAVADHVGMSTEADDWWQLPETWELLSDYAPPAQAEGFEKFVNFLRDGKGSSWRKAEGLSKTLYDYVVVRAKTKTGGKERISEGKKDRVPIDILSRALEVEF